MFEEPPVAEIIHEQEVILHHESKYFYVDFIAGTIGGAAGVIVGHPLDTVKVRLQSQAMSGSAKRYTGTFNCIATILREEKLRGLYKGMASPIVGVAAINSLLFGVHGWFMHHISGNRTPTVSNIFWAGCGSGFVNAFLACPMELVKIRLQNQSNGASNSLTSYAGPIDCCKKLYKQGGMRAFFKGMHVTVWRETPSYGAYFASYEIFSHLFTPPGQALDVPSPGLLLAGGLTEIVGWLSTYPFDVIKTRIQSDLSGKSMGLWDTARTIYRSEGIRPFFSGLGATAVRAFPTNAATFYAVCWVRNLLEPKSKHRTRE
ncbi:mitochondrial carrier domain-containing protein [Chytriomyces sp. MP71]|nr:mitochondrial carrier domain-containing protein [Chytriomyces sp. MP71]